jgi:hypothetical protein
MNSTYFQNLTKILPHEDILQVLRDMKHQLFVVNKSVFNVGDKTDH